MVISAVWPSALLANVVHQQKRESEWGDFSTEYPTQNRAHKNSPSPAQPLTHRQTYFRLVAPRWHLISAGRRGGSFRVGSHGMTHRHHFTSAFQLAGEEVILGMEQSVSLLNPLLWETHLPGDQRYHGTNPEGQKTGAPWNTTLPDALIGGHRPTRYRDWPAPCLYTNLSSQRSHPSILVVTWRKVDPKNLRNPNGFNSCLIHTHKHRGEFFLSWLAWECTIKWILSERAWSH